MPRDYLGIAADVIGLPKGQAYHVIVVAGEDCDPLIGQWVADRLGHGVEQRNWRRDGGFGQERWEFSPFDGRR